jgi:NADH:ubiquinone oxidoreductase subunit
MIVRHINRLRLFRKHRQNLDENKKLIGEDRFGNEYFQEYSAWGLPTRRECQYIDYFNLSQHRDNSFW